jgi:CRISPR/Cas system-associated exonuclease Cas4 (RecB family)
MIDEKKLRHNVLTLMDREDVKPKPNKYRVSELIYCLIKAYRSRTEGKTFDINGKMLSGSMLHEKFPKLLRGVTGSKVKFEVECSKAYDGYEIIGHADAIDKERVYELKFSASKVTEQLPFYYYLQANAYATMNGLPEFSVIFINSYSLDVKILSEKQDTIAFEHIEKQAAYLHDCIQKKQVPKGPMFDWECKFCSMRLDCPMHLVKEKGLKELQEA